MNEILPVVVLVVLVTGCGTREERTPPTAQRPSDRETTGSGQDLAAKVPQSREEQTEDNQEGPDGRDDGSGVRTYNTGDSEVWPSFDLPLVIEIEPPEVPPEIMEPSPEIPDG